MIANTRIKTYAVYNLLCIQTFKFSISIKFIKVRYSKSQIRICKKLYSFCFSKTHNQSIYIFFYSSLLKKFCKNFCFFNKTLIFHICAHYNSAWVQIIIKRFTFTKKLRTEYYILTSGLFTNRLSVSNRNC